MNSPLKLKTTGVKKTRLALLESQGGLCSLCSFPCTDEQAVLDHDHKGGHVRAVLHRSCNSLLGKCENNAPRYGMKFEQLVAFLAGAAKYIVTHQENVTGLIHPSHFTAEEKVERRKAKAKRTRAKVKKAKLEGYNGTSSSKEPT